MAPEIRRLVEEDARLAARAIGRVKPLAEQETALSESSAASFLRDSRNVLVVALEGEEPVGYAVAYMLERADRRGPMLLFYEIEVQASRRRRGIGRAMVDRLRRVASEHGACKMWVLTDQSNAAARALYRGCRAREAGSQLLIEWLPVDLAP